jgi:hypothetical protein
MLFPGYSSGSYSPPKIAKSKKTVTFVPTPRPVRTMLGPDRGGVGLPVIRGTRACVDRAPFRIARDVTSIRIFVISHFSTSPVFLFFVLRYFSQEKRYPLFAAQKAGKRFSHLNETLFYGKILLVTTVKPTRFVPTKVTIFKWYRSVVRKRNQSSRKYLFYYLKQKLCVRANADFYLYVAGSTSIQSGTRGKNGGSGV